LWVFERLVLTFGGGKEDESELFAKVVVGGTDGISSVFDKEKIERADNPGFNRGLQHRRASRWQIIPVLIGFTLGVASMEASGSDQRHSNAPAS